MSNASSPIPIRSKSPQLNACPGSSTWTPFQPRLLLVGPEFDLSQHDEQMVAEANRKNPGAAWGSDAPLPSPPSKPPESNPSKAYPHDMDTERKYSPDMPGAEQADQRG